eukprot:CAMPEP_0198720260 /NCGR_PEP_ID=MMETSP1471-20131121/61114_1 /TAXON_ID=41880 /ORGANISM="Pycnococcus provasolii, Strain RCC733" /LENGTH=93 /DNA_ID=CAMNT_0044481083 /DNA_START=61 /DNA_END=338 /DNA_ORIENTATION=+
MSNVLATSSSVTAATVRPHLLQLTNLTGAGWFGVTVISRAIPFVSVSAIRIRPLAVPSAMSVPLREKAAHVMSGSQSPRPPWEEDGAPPPPPP